jgi:hypothetical protein
MKDPTVHPSSLKTSTDIDVTPAMNDFHTSTPIGNREKFDWSPSSPTSCQDSVDLSEADSDSSPVSVDSQVVLNTFNTSLHSDSDSEAGDSDSLDLHDSNSAGFVSWTLVSPKSISSANKDGKLVITQVPLKSRTPIADEENHDDVRDISFPPKKRQKTMLSMLSHSKKPFGSFKFNNGNDIKSGKRNNPKISFKETVDVLSIPTRYEYSPEMRSQLWSSINEINENAARNTIEFASEGWDWRNVTLDHDMCHCPTTGQYIHPVHYYNQSQQYQMPLPPN